MISPKRRKGAERNEPGPYSVGAIIKRAGGKRAKVRIYDGLGHFGSVRTRAGRESYFRGSAFDINGHGSAQVASDKGYTLALLKNAGFPVPDWTMIFRGETPAVIPDGAFPLVVKPNNLSKGKDVCFAGDRVVLKRILADMSVRYEKLLATEYIPGNDYRFLVLDGKLEAAYERKKVCVTGDGERTLRGLLLPYLERDREGILSDALRLAGADIRRVPAMGEIVCPIVAANISAGGKAVDVTDRAGSGYRKLCRRIAEAMSLRFCGIDIITTEDIAFAPRDYRIIEVNSSPSVSGFAATGDGELLRTRRIFRKIYRKLRKL